VDLVDDADFDRIVDPDYSPIGWHLGHIGMTEAYWILQRAMGAPPPRTDYLRLFSPVSRPRAARADLPTRSAIGRYLQEVRTRVEEFLAAADLEGKDPLLAQGFIFHSVLQHEWQHQETLVELIRLGDCLSAPPPPLPPTTPSRSFPPAASAQTGTPERVRIPAGPCVIGSDALEAYDNERPAHRVEVEEFGIDPFPVTNARYLEFVSAGGYRQAEWWSAEGWSWRQEQGVDAPRFWERDTGGGWLTCDPGRRHPVPPDCPVEGVSWHEAQAFCRWAGARLPTEVEWEKAAAWDGDHARRFPWGAAPPLPVEATCDLVTWSTAPIDARPAGRSAVGAWDMGGNVWEWTESPFVGYPGFRPFPYRGYSGAFVGGPYRVLRGGSWATPGPLLRCSFRNWYRPGYRQGALGFRCAAR
jgi:iron(II)-dependent oxidoreductase